MLSEMESKLASSAFVETSSPSIVSSLMLPSLIVSGLLNLSMGGIMFYNYLTQDINRMDTEPTQFYEFMPPLYQEQTDQNNQDDEDTAMEGKMDRLQEIRMEYLDGINHEYASQEHVYDNMYMDDIYHSLPRSLY